MAAQGLRTGNGVDPWHDSKRVPLGKGSQANPPGRACGVKPKPATQDCHLAPLPAQPRQRRKSPESVKASVGGAWLFTVFQKASSSPMYGTSHPVAHRAWLTPPAADVVSNRMGGGSHEQAGEGRDFRYSSITHAAKQHVLTWHRFERETRAGCSSTKGWRRPGEGV